MHNLPAHMLKMPQQKCVRGVRYYLPSVVRIHVWRLRPVLCTLFGRLQLHTPPLYGKSGLHLLEA